MRNTGKYCRAIATLGQFVVDMEFITLGLRMRRAIGRCC
jgi:hypothetical protein